MPYIGRGIEWGEFVKQTESTRNIISMGLI